jgi:3',5'-cyclic-AMP phosphodiesterase
MKRIAQLTDLHLDDSMALSQGFDTRANLVHVLEDIREKGIRDVVLTGDLGESHTIGWLADQLSLFGFSSHYLLGNHDNSSDYSAMPDFMENNHAEGCYYSFHDEGFLQLYLDSGRYEIGPGQFAWIKEQCSVSSEPILLFIHHPVLDCGDTPMDRFYPMNGRDILRDFLLSLQRPVHIVCGHYHTCHEQQVLNISQHVTLSTYVQLKKTGPLLVMDGREIGYRIVEIDEGGFQSFSVVVPLLVRVS